MDYFARLILFFCLCIAGHAFAAPCPASYAFYGYSLTGYAEQRSSVPGSLAAAQQWCTSVCGSNYQYQGGIQDGAQGVTGYCGFWSNGTWYGNRCQFTLSKVPQYIDQNNSVHSSDPGTCNPPVQCPLAGEVVAPAGTVFEAGNGLTNVVCLAGCEASAFLAAKDGGKNYVWGPIVSAGRACTAASGPATSEASSKCALGKCPGTINGQPICVPCSQTKQDTSASSSETAASAASGATPGSGQTTKHSGSSSTTCAGGTCTTTSTRVTENPDGSTETKTTTTERPQGDYCKENPKAGACVGSESSWGGACQAFICEGDAVQCAQARGAWELACQLKTEATNSTVQAGTGAISGSVDASVRDQLGMNTSQVFNLASYLDSTSLFGTAGACPSDVTLSLGIGSVTLPFASMCPQLNLVGVAMMGLAYLIAAFIVFRPGKGV